MNFFLIIEYITIQFIRYLPWWEFVAQKKNDVDKRPYFTYTVLFFCTVFYLLSIGMNGWVFESFDVNPMLGPSADVLLHVSFFIINFRKS